MFFTDIKIKNPGLDFISPIISVMTKHLYSTSSVINVINLVSKIAEKYEETLQEKIEKDILELGVKLLERIVDMNELKKQIKLFKDSSSSFAPAPFNEVSQLENSLLFFICILHVKLYFPICLPEIFEPLKMLIKKELGFIEGFKRDATNEKNPKYLEILDVSSKRMRIELAILKVMDKKSAEFYKNNKEINVSYPYANALREINQFSNEILDKLTDPLNLIYIINHLHENLEFLLENENSIKEAINFKPKETFTQGQVSKIKSVVTGATSSVLNVFQEKKFENVKFEDSLIEKLVNTIINLLRKNFSEEDLCIAILTLFIKLAKIKKDICNLYVKAGCPRILLQIIDNTFNKKLVALALELLTLIAKSSNENLSMLSNLSKVKLLNRFT